MLAKRNRNLSSKKADAVKERPCTSEAVNLHNGFHRRRDFQGFYKYFLLPNVLRKLFKLPQTSYSRHIMRGCRSGQTGQTQVD